MAQSTSNTPLPLPSWLLTVGSLLITAHLGILGVSVLAAPSGPWATPFGMDMMPGPAFVMGIDEVTRPNYLRPLKMTHNYHFMTNRPGMPGVWLEVKLRGETGEVVETLRIPDPQANPWVRHRQEMLARHLLDDRPAQPPAGEVIPAPGARVQEVTLWEMGPDRQLHLRPTPEHLIPRDRPVSRPAELSLALARSYVRYLRRIHGAASVEVVRRSREPLPPLVLFQPDLPPTATEEFVASFGEMTR